MHDPLAPEANASLNAGAAVLEMLVGLKPVIQQTPLHTLDGCADHRRAAFAHRDRHGSNLEVECGTVSPSERRGFDLFAGEGPAIW